MMKRFDVTVTFDGNDRAYQDWLRGDSLGYVINTRREPDSDYMVPHRARCKTIQSYQSTMTPGAFAGRLVPYWHGERMDDSMAVEGLLEVE